MDINLIDLIMALVLVAGLINGFRKGIFSQLGGIAGVLLGVWVAYKFGSKIGQWLNIDISPILAYVLLFVGGMLAAWVVSGLLEGVLRGIGLNFINRLGGAVVSLVFSSLVLSLALGLFCKCNDALGIVEPGYIAESQISGYVQRVSDFVFPYLESARDAIMDEVGISGAGAVSEVGDIATEQASQI